MRTIFTIIVLVLSIQLKIIECKICPSTDIRSQISNLSKLEGCKIIFGYLKIVLIDVNATVSDYDKYVFPELVEITEYLLMYNVHNLTSIAKLFPNLRVIRGKQLIRDYSLIIFDLPHIQEIGLSNLLHIERGGVKIDKCPQICYVETINWSMIGTGLDYHDIAHLTCPCSPKCKGYCWNYETCQKPNTNKCHHQCLGCSVFNSSSHCWACKNFDNNGTCVDQCPSDKYIIRDAMKCVTKEECSSGMFNGTWWIFGNECLKSCPAKYEQIDSVKGGCRRCKNDFCPKDCLGLTIETLAHLQQMSGCTTINGSLYIKITKSIPYYELEENLGSIHIITGSLRIQRVKIISSLSFLKNLRYINGTNLIYNKYALFVSENPNLQKLWDYNNIDNFSLKILNGTIGFHYNSQLCLNEILKLVNLTGLTDYNVTDISLTSNGDKSTCNLIDLKVHLTNINSTNVTMTWNEISLEHNESYIGYIIYYTEDASGNATGFDSQDVCETRGWRSVYVSNNTAMLLKLKPFTQYAYYIKMYSSSVSGGQTSIMYFRTLPSDPQEVREAWAIALNDYSIKLEWKPPKIQNGVLSHYKISYYVEKDMVSFYDNRDYCLYPFTEHVKTVNENQISSETQSENKCQCEKDDNVRNEHQFFIDGSHKICYIFDCHEFEYGTESSDSSSSTAMIEVNKRNSVKKAKNKDISVVNNKYTELYTKNPNLTSFIISDLPYFTMHIFFIEACNKDVKECSGKVQAFNRTLKKLNADDIPNDFNVKVDDTSVYIKWSEPKHPNGAILSYNIYQTKLDEQHYKPVIKCITRLQHEKSHYTYTIINIQPGQYSIRLRAISVAGEGRYTKPLQFTIAAPINHGVWIAIIVIVFLITFGLVAFYFWNRRKRTFQNIQLIASVNPEYVSAVYVDDAWEIQRDDIELHNELGHGMFGKVYSGVIKSRNQLCAVKTVNEGASLNYCVEFLNEALVMQSVSNAHHVVKLLGVVSRGHPPLVAMELMMRGDLKSYLRRCRESSSQNITSNEVYRMAIEIADGMAYLAAKKFVHRDLAARNCMVAHDRTVKIGDFGMTRDIYVTDYYRKETRGLMPVRWMAPESLADGVFTSQSDIWSYGIVLWEISTLAEQPYQGLANEQVLEFVISRGKLKRPPDCTDLTFEIMDECWHWRPNDRPTFGDIVEKLESHVGQDFKIVSYYFNRHGHEYLNTSNRSYF